MLKTSIALTDLARLDRQLRRDQDTPLRQLQERDRSVGAKMQKAPPRRQLLAWLDATAPRRQPDPVEAAGITVSFWLGLLGILAGAAAMSGLLLAEQERPLNVLLFLTLFVGIQWLLLAITLLVTLTLALRGDVHLPFENLNPARWLFRRSYQRLAGSVRRELLTPVLRLALLSWGQVFGVFFNLAAMATFVVILSVVDRSFGWSSTLDISAAGLHDSLRWLSLPWAWWLPEATVNAELVAGTRYQSLQTEFSGEQVLAMRQWWPFLLACLGVYGFLPRLLLWLGFHVAYRRQLTATFTGYPGARLVLDRMNSPVVHTQARSHEQALDLGNDNVLRSALPANRERLIVNWSGALNPKSRELLDRLGLREDDIMNSGLDLDDDLRLAREINAAGRDVVVLVKSWEPPLSDLGDFLRSVSPKLDCYLLLMPLPHRAIKSDELTDWQQFARQKHHPRLTVVNASEESAEARS